MMGGYQRETPVIATHLLTLMSHHWGWWFGRLGVG